MKITFIYQGRYHIRDSVTLEYLSAIAKQLGNSTSIVYDQDVFGVSDNVMYIPSVNKILTSYRKVAEKIKKAAPDYAVFFNGLTRSNWNKVICNNLAGSGIKTILISYSNKEDSNFDIVLTGEPEQVFKEFLVNGAADSRDLMDFNNLPLPDKSLFKNYIDFSDSYMVYSSKGCPFNCSYCEESVCKKQYGEKYFRQRSVNSVISELVVGLKTYSFKEVIFKDSVFTWDKIWLNSFLNEYSKKIAVPFKCFAKAEGFTKETALLLKQSGCYCVEFGLQSFNEELKKTVLSRCESNDSFMQACTICDEIGLSYDIDYMFGIRGESVKDHIEAAEKFAGMHCLNRIKCHNMVSYENQDAKGFFSHTAGTKDMKSINKAFAKLFKIQPVLHAGVVRILLSAGLWRVFNFVPLIAVMVCQMIIGLNKKDLRFSYYLKYYPLKLKNAIAG